MEIPKLNITPGRYTEIKFYDNEILKLIKALKYYQGDFPQNSWTRSMINFLESQEFTEVSIK
ncbi:MAG: hypothetical protein ACO24P_03710 [Candidatus Nanopelagicaceae bacterium]